MPDPIFVARGTRDHELLPRLANRHGLIAGATGTGKTVSLRVLAEGFSRLGVPVFLADVKGDLGGLAAAGGDDPRILARAKELGLDTFAGAAFPVAFWDVGGTRGHPIRTTISEMGPVLLARLLNLNDTQAGVLQLVFRVADDEGLLLLDLKDLRALLQHAAENAAQYRTRSTATCRPPAWAPSSAPCSPSRNRAATSSSASPPSTWMTSCRPTPMAAA